MKKITAVIGSPRGEKSTTAAMVTNFLELVKEYNQEVEYELILLDGSNMAYCKGCMACTKVGECVVKDGLQQVQAKLKESDLVILGSPVYVDHVSAQFKTFADRTFIWLHTLRLFGKPSLCAITTAGSGLKPARKFIHLIQYLLGTIPVGTLEAVEYFDRDYATMDFCRKKYSGLAQKVAKILKEEIKLKPKFMNQFYFWAMKSKAKYGAEWLPYENKFWKDSGWGKLSYSKVYRQMKGR
ncbi:MAG: flavodoxin family protein [Clostridia bacterium]|nr:flavodoxin family protein [Clostridia bacterium]